MLFDDSGAYGCLGEKAHDGKRCAGSQKEREGSYWTEEIENGTYKHTYIHTYIGPIYT